MSGDRSGIRRLVLGTGVALAGYTALVRPLLLTWGATRDEALRAYPGDELVADAHGSSTMAATLPAPPGAVWPWLAQMGCNRGGWYSWDRLDNGGRPSAARILPQWQHIEQGQRLDSTPAGDAWFTVAVLVPDRTLVLHAQLEMPSGRPFEPGPGPLPGGYTESIWGFHLEPAPAGTTRLVVRTRTRGRPRPLTRSLDLLFWEPAHLIMQLRQFHNLRARVGGADQGRRSGAQRLRRCPAGPMRVVRDWRARVGRTRGMP